MRTFSNFQICNTTSLPPAAMLSITSPGLIHLITGRLEAPASPRSSNIPHALFSLSSSNPPPPPESHTLAHLLPRQSGPFTVMSGVGRGQRGEQQSLSKTDSTQSECAFRAPCSRGNRDPNFHVKSPDFQMLSVTLARRFWSSSHHLWSVTTYEYQ